MIAILKHNATPQQQENLINWLKGMNIGVHISEGEYQTVLGLIGDTSKIDIDLLEGLDVIERVTRISEPYKKANRK